MKEVPQKWIDAGYEILALEGPEEIQVEKLARKLGLNKSGFYHHFGHREVYFASLLEYHIRLDDFFLKEAADARQFDPDALNLIVKYRNIALVQLQLRRYIKNPEYRTIFEKVQKRNEKIFLPLWTAHIKMEENPQLAADLWNILRDLYYLRMDRYNFDYENLRDLVHEYGKVINVLKRSSYNEINSPPCK